MTSGPQTPGWQLRFDNPDFRGWAVVAGYVMAAVICARTAWILGKREGEEKRGATVWWLLASGLLFLGINKQLNLQTLLIVLVRQAALAGGWYAQRRLTQRVFSALLTLAGLTALWILRARFRPFFAANPRVFAGMLIMVLFVLVRTASINHIFARPGRPEDDEQENKWTWVLEIGGSACLGWAAIRATAETCRGAASD
jgi:hypothetical protein